MKILQIGPYPPPYGGVESNLIAIHNYLLKHDIPAKVINVTRYRDSGGEGVYYPNTWIDLLRLLFKLDYDIAHIHIGGQITPRLLGLCLACSMLPHKKSVLTFHSGGYPSSEEGKTANPRTMRGFVFRKLDAVICVNDEIAELFRRFGLKTEQIKVICPFSFPRGISDHSLPDKLFDFFQSHSPVLLTVGGLETEYGLEAQIDVLGPVLENHPNCGLVIIGSGSLEREIRDYINSKSYCANIYLCGDMPHSATLLAMQECDTFLRTSLYDGDSIAVREALQLGIPTIATDTAKRPDGAILIPVNETDALLKAIEKSLSEQSDNRDSAETSEENLEAVIGLYKELLNR